MFLGVFSVFGGVFGVVLGLFWYWIATVLLLVCLSGWGVVLSVGGLDGMVLCLRFSFASA